MVMDDYQDNMDVTANISPVLLRVQEALVPYIRSRQDVLHIRQVLAAHFDSHIEPPSSIAKSGSLSLQNSSINVTLPTADIKDLWRDYLRCLKSNVKARREYNKLKIKHHVNHKDPGSQSVVDHQNSNKSSLEHLGHLEDHLLLVKQRQRYERLTILQNYVDNLAQKSVTILSCDGRSSDNALPHLPEDMDSAVNSEINESASTKVEKLILGLKSAILKAKATLKSERNTLSRAQPIKVGKTDIEVGQIYGQHSKLHALSETRNELINWVEGELGMAGEDDLVEDSDEICPRNEQTVAGQLDAVKGQYVHYIELRKSLLDAVTDRGTPSFTPYTENEEDSSRQVDTGSICPIVLPFLEDILAISIDQKSLIQQRTHLTSSLVKQYKATSQTFDRSADESHLLPAFPLPISHSLRLEQARGTTFADEVSSNELPRISDKVRAWTYAADLAATNTKDTVLENIENGSNAIEEARQVIIATDTMLGHGIEIGARPDLIERNRDLWGLLNGQVGVLKREDM